MKLAALGAATAALPALAKTKRNLEVGHTGITWPNDVVQAITDTGNLGFYGFETFGDVLTKWESQGGLQTALEQHHLPLISGYCTLDLTDSTKRHLGYCPLGQGKVNIPGILDLMAGRKIHGKVMGELDNDPKNPSPTTPVELVKTSKLYLETLGITFRA